MKQSTPGRRAAIVLAVLIASAVVGRLSAHDFWIDPSTFEPVAGSGVRIGLRVGEHFQGDKVARRAARIVSFFAVGPNGQTEISGSDGMEPAGLLRVTSPGTYLLGYRSRQSPVTLKAAEFETYLKEEGLERIIAARAKAGKADAPGVELFSRCAKSLLTVAGAPSAGHDRALGLTLELIPERHPSALPPGGLMPVRLLHEGRPLEGALVVALHQASRQRLSGRTNKEGRVTLALADGVWLIKTVHMIPAAAESGADWESLWASLTFKAKKAAAASSR